MNLPLILFVYLPSFVLIAVGIRAIFSLRIQLTNKQRAEGAPAIMLGCLCVCLGIIFLVFFLHFIPWIFTGINGPPDR